MQPKLLSLSALALISACVFTSSAHALTVQNCSGTLTADVNMVSITTGGVQQLSLSVPLAESDWQWQVIGSFGTDQPASWFGYAGLRLNTDRYLWRMYDSHAGFVQGVTSGFLGGPLVPVDAQGHANFQVVIPPGLPSTFIGRTLHHGVYHTDTLSLLPSCGSGTVPLLLVP